MRDAQNPDHVSLSVLVDRLKDGRFVIPDFQRDFEWKPWDIRDLMRSIFLDYYIGSLLLWKGTEENFDALACESIYGFDGDSANNRQHIVLDGQQRLTAMYYTFVAPDVPVPNRSNRFLYFIRVDRFMSEDYDEAFDYDWTTRTLSLLDDQQLQWERHIFPLAIVGRGGWDLGNWVQGYEQHWQGKLDEAVAAGDEDGAAEAKRFSEDAHSFGELLRGITQQYQVAFIELDKELALDKVCDIFTQINSKGVRLDAFDLINALLKPKGLQLKHMWREAEPRLDFVESEKMNVYVLQVMSILRQAYCSPKYLYYLMPRTEKTVREPDGSLRKEVLVKSPEEFESRWWQAVDAIERAIKLLGHPQELGAISSAYLPYVSILPAFAALQEAVRELDPGAQLEAQRKVRHWYWASVFTNRYSGSVESTAARDYLDVKAWFSDDAAQPALIAEFEERFRRLDLKAETKRGSSVYNGIFNLLVVRGARDWMTGNLPTYGDLDDHHIVPKSWGRDNGLGNGVDTILNRTPLTADTNRKVIRDRLPNAYLPELIQANGESTVRATLESHFISPKSFEILLRDPFTVEDFEEFVSERQRTFQAAIEDLLVKERLDLSPDLRDLDAKLEDIELRLREHVANALGAAGESLPGHISPKIDDRIQVAAKKNPAMDLDHFSTLSGRLEYADLRELEATIVNKPLWPLFEASFASKEGVAKRFDQMAELRNGIRHSRSVDEVTKKDGEAALLWFAQVLDR